MTFTYSSDTMPQPLNVRAVNAATPGNAFAPLPETADVLRAGTYSKTLTFALSTTTP